MIGTTISHYLITEKLGEGGMGVVYKAKDLHLERHVAFKVVSESLLNTRFRARLFREAKLAASLNHPNIAHVYEVGEANGICFLAMEFIEGGTLREAMKSTVETLPSLVGYLVQVAGALHAAHSKGVIHCDLKPQNIMVTPDGLVKVLDFGLARLVKEDKRDKVRGNHVNLATQTLSSLWADGLFEGTIGYMSPEQAEGKSPADQSTDIFSFGCILFEVAARRLPFWDSSPIRSLHRLIYDPAPRLEAVTPGAHPALQRALDLCLSKEPGQRASSLKDVSKELEAFLQSAPDNRPRRVGRGHHLQNPNRKRIWVSVICLLVALVIPGAILFFRQPARYRGQAAPVNISSIAVIPFFNQSAKPGTDFLSDGLSEGLINSLAQLRDLKVVARTSSFQFKSDSPDVVHIAHTLGVQALITGRLSESEGQLRVSVDLVSGRDGRELWGAQYHPGTNDLASVQDQIVREVVGRIRTPLTKSNTTKLAETSGVNPEAYSLFLRGRYEMRLYNPQSTQKAVEYYQEALALDPGFALANAELANSYRLLSGAGILKPSEAMPLAEAAALRATATNYNLAQAHAVLADIKRDQWDWSAAEREYNQALALNANLVTARAGFAIYLSMIGRRDKAVEEALKARGLDPLGVPTAINVGAVHYNCRRYEDAIRELKRSLGLDPSASALWTWIGIVYGGSGQYTEAIKAYKKAMLLGDRTAATRCDYGYSLAKSNRRKEALAILNTMQESKEFVPATALAILFVGLGQKERALQLLEEAYASKDQLLQYIGVESHFDSLHREPRFQNLVAKLKLPS